MFAHVLSASSLALLPMGKRGRPQNQARVHSWDDVASAGCAAQPSPGTAGEELVKLLLGKYREGNLNAKEICVICYWSSLGGVQGPAERLSYPPDRQSGAYQRHLDAALEFDVVLNSLYPLYFPGMDKYSTSRATVTTFVQPPHECLVRELEGNPGLLEEARNHIATTNMPPAYCDNPAVKAAQGDEVVIPLQFYLDGVPYHQRRQGHDSVLGFWVMSSISKERHLVALLRKSEMCSCGCKSWCSLAAVFSYIRWSLEACAEGVWPCRRHDNLPWRGCDADRQRKAGSSLGFRAALTHIKGDWAEMAISIGLPTWRDVAAPCPSCKCSSQNFLDFEGVGLASNRWGHADHGSYLKACSDCEIWCTLQDEAAKKLLCSALAFDKRATGSGSRGLCVKWDLPQFGLRRGDRVEPNTLMGDVVEVFKLNTFPAQVLFWRRSAESRARHRNPLFDRPGAPQIGIGIEILSPDALHCLHLGVMKFWCQHVLWEAIRADIWQTNVTQEKAHCELSVQLMRSSLWTFYRNWSRRHPEEPLTQLGNLTLSMLGSYDQQVLKTKGGETFGLLVYCIDLLEKHQSKIKHGAVLLKAGSQLYELYKTVKEEPSGQVRTKVAQSMFDRARLHLRLAQIAEIPYRPKHHQMMHLVLGVRHLGNFRDYWNFKDESDNKMLASVSRSAHRSKFAKRVFHKMRLRSDSSLGK